MTGSAGYKPAPLHVAIPIFAATSLLFFFALYIILPVLRNKGLPWFAIYNVVLVLPTLLLVCAAFVAYRIEGHSFTWHGVRRRFRLGRLDASTWFWTAALSVFMFGGHGALYIAFVLTVPALLIENREKHGASGLSLLYVAVFFLCSWLIWQMRPIFDQIPFHSEPATLRDFLAQFGPASFMGLQLKGQWWIPAYYLAVLLAGNIAGEELWWRGYLLPRQEIVHGSSTWIVHGAGVPSLLPDDRLGHDSYVSNLLCFGLCGTAQEEHVAWDGWPHVWKHRVVAANSAWCRRTPVLVVPSEIFVTIVFRVKVARIQSQCFHMMRSGSVF
jgi:hypothetical protein